MNIKIPREKQGFLLSSVGPPMTSLVPYSIFILFYGGLIQGVNPDLNGFQEYIKALPFNFYANDINNWSTADCTRSYS